ncbi:MAG: PQQ-binding-like beta-propeller repeat protein, partial [Gemmatales bacterium]|nr:PQQ-binding-like beta-propeller repeat protein [Gemmatales bacterium]
MRPSWILGMAWGLSLWASLWCSEPVVQDRDWPMLARDPGRSGATPVEIRPPMVRKWYRLFADEGLMAGMQPVLANGVVYVGTLRGILHAIDDATGQDRWTYRAGGAILHSCAVAGDKVFFGAADGKIYALRTQDGRLAWTVPTGAAVWNAPLVYRGVVLVGSRDGKLYAVEAESGHVRWTAQTGGPILASPALDVKSLRVYVASEDMCVYAVEWASGRILWRSPKLPGATFRGYHPVVAPDGAV